MKKSILAVAGLAALAGVAGPIAGVAGAVSFDEHTGIVLNGKEYADFATSTFNVVCNALGGYQVTVGTTGFESATLTGEDAWSYAKNGLTTGDVSSWTLVSNHTEKDKAASPAEIVAKTANAVTTDDFTITYSMEVSSKQQAANDYKAAATYTFAKL